MLLIDRYIHNIQWTQTSLQKRIPNTLVDVSNVAIITEVREAEKIYFEQSTMNMLMDYAEHFPERIESPEFKGMVDQAVVSLMEAVIRNHGSIWIEFKQTITIHDTIGAIFIYMPSNQLETGRDELKMLLIEKEDAIHSKLMFLMRDATGWQYDPIHAYVCPWEDCTYEQGVFTACERCDHIKTLWSILFFTICLIARQYLAEQHYEEKPFFSTHRAKKGDNPKKKGKPVTTKYVYKVIDANEIIIPVRPDEYRPRREGDSWLQKAMMEDPMSIVYETIRTRPFSRTYRSERYRESGLIGTTIEFAKGIERQQPVKRDRIDKKVTKVKASHYEEGGEYTHDTNPQR